ncbi:MAG: hypothetical protein U1D66_10800 [Erythrobacter sp.]|nr:hypothetical protein [Erythrobacter sp.]
MRLTITQRLEAQLRLALLGDCGCEQTIATLSQAAQANGMTWAEIDSALSGRSFEARTDAAIAYACAIKSGNSVALDLARTRAARLEIGTDELAAVAHAARRILMESET